MGVAGWGRRHPHLPPQKFFHGQRAKVEAVFARKLDVHILSGAGAGKSWRCPQAACQLAAADLPAAFEAGRRGALEEETQGAAAASSGAAAESPPLQPTQKMSAQDSKALAKTLFGADYVNSDAE